MCTCRLWNYSHSHLLYSSCCNHCFFCTAHVAILLTVWKAHARAHASCLSPRSLRYNHETYLLHISSRDHSHQHHMHMHKFGCHSTVSSSAGGADTWPTLYIYYFMYYFYVWPHECFLQCMGNPSHTPARTAVLRGQTQTNTNAMAGTVASNATPNGTFFTRLERVRLCTCVRRIWNQHFTKKCYMLHNVDFQ